MPFPNLPYLLDRDTAVGDSQVLVAVEAREVEAACIL